MTTCKSSIKTSNSAAIAGRLLAPALAQPAAFAQSANEAGRDISNIQETDPQGFTWMLICIGLILACALTLIGVTAFFALKGKKRGN